jgi:hypothetical protein
MLDHGRPVVIPYEDVLDGAPPIGRQVWLKRRHKDTAALRRVFGVDGRVEKQRGAVGAIALFRGVPRDPIRVRNEEISTWVLEGSKHPALQARERGIGHKFVLTKFRLTQPEGFLAADRLWARVCLFDVESPVGAAWNEDVLTGRAPLRADRISPLPNLLQQSRAYRQIRNDMYGGRRGVHNGRRGVPRGRGSRERRRERGVCQDRGFANNPVGGPGRGRL